MYLQKTQLLTEGSIIDLQTAINDHISNGSQIDLVIPNKGMKNGWIIIYRPNKI